MGEKTWTQKGALPSGSLPKAVTVSADGYGLVSSYVDPSEGPPSEQLKQRKAQLLRVTASGSEQVYEAAGWIQALDGHGAVWFAVGATAKATGAGSDYRLLRSTDGGKTWQGRGLIPAPSLAQVLAVDERQAWVLGAGYLAGTLDGGASWQSQQLTGERNPTLERLRRLGQDVAVVGRGGIAVTRDLGHSWTRDDVGGAYVHDFENGYLVVSKDGKVGVGKRDDRAVTWLSGLPADRHPLRITSSGQTLRVLTRAADPSTGVDLTVFHSEDGGKSWTGIPLGLRAEADIAGEYGLGVSLAGELRGNF